MIYIFPRFSLQVIPEKQVYGVKGLNVKVNGEKLIVDKIVGVKGKVIAAFEMFNNDADYPAAMEKNYNSEV